MVDEENKDSAATSDDWAAAMAEQDSAGSGASTTAAKAARQKGASQEASYENIKLNDLAEGRMSGSGHEMNLDMILDIPVTISMEIGRSRISIRNLLQLTQGSVVELDRLAGEPLDVLINGTLIAHGEVVVVNEKFGIRLTDVISAAERVKRLK
ncbi:MAG: flagellar motor switch protein FliN [Gammaproteobacteria bacterium RBG_16_57_12]|nr:MAG: flagellar motor switch protein FliN [Gammaproteobacteria bacterium RBG_16_57_12]